MNFCNTYDVALDVQLLGLHQNVQFMWIPSVQLRQ